MIDFHAIQVMLKQLFFPETSASAKRFFTLVSLNSDGESF